MVKSYLSRIQELEGELLKFKNLKNSRQRVIDCLDLDEDEFHSKSELFPSSNYSSDSESKIGDVSGSLSEPFLVLLFLHLSSFHVLSSV